ncbi:uncharacterized protein DUF3348 [Trinickia symbiotica]|uniref:DUF3348 domain-containing protein n=1 Tax=Trinickia symbiotica TaxID=863227 RepID=UPI000D4EC4B8|nr:DUF3348 domain-containing protein [Trinickia symbiotica]PPK46003.1 uncharacterized protein DUF3348 [Trinickia symbiotica]
MKAPQRTAFSSQTLIRLLARLADARIPESTQSLSERLSQWLDWTDAIAMSTALAATPAPVSDTQAAIASDENECSRVRASLADAIARDSVLAIEKRSRSTHGARREGLVDADEVVDYTVFRHCYLSMQQAMDASIGKLRERLRRSLAAKRPALAQLAAVDAVMERALSAREHNLLTAIPDLLNVRFERLRQASQDAAAAHDDDREGHAESGNPPAPHDAWLDAFRHEMRSVLLAELSLRFQPVEGLLAALRTS